MTAGAGGEGTRGTGLFDGPAIATGAALALAIAAPVIVASSVIGIDDESNTVFVAFPLYLAGQTLGGWLAARRRPDAPLANGAMASICAYVVLGLVASVLRVVRGESLDPWSLTLNFFLAASAGLLGGVIATWKRPSPDTDEPDTDEPGTGRPGAGRPGTGRPGARPG